MELELALNEASYSTRARTRALVLGEVENVLTGIRRGRESARFEDQLQLDRLAAVMPVARGAGMSFEAISETSGVSRPTMARLREPDRARWSDAELAILVALGLGGPQTRDQATSFARALDLGQGRELGAAIDVLLTRGLLATIQARYEGELATYYRLTRAGTDSLASRLAHAGIGEGFRWSVFFSVDESRGRALETAGEAKLGTGEVALLWPGQGQNEHWELAFMVRASSREEALSEGRGQFAELCRAAGVDPSTANGAAFLLGPPTL
jgi:hypothetical protein